ncbi:MULTISPECIES: GntR family transcriptional regulator [unclassified Variovorax]|nr:MULTISPECIES: GntR family transcriptional regulator [unclassified Variovorax]
MSTSSDNSAVANLPLFAQIEAQLRQRIVVNELVAGSKLPSEAELEIEFGVSRITVRQALAALHAKGLIQKVNGKGSFVTRPSDAPKLGPLTGFFDHMRAHGREALGKTLSVREVEAPAAVAEALRLAPGEPVTAITMVRSVDGKPLLYGIAWGEAELVKALIREDIDTNDFMTLLEGRLGFRMKSTHIETSAVPAGKLRARHLGIDAAAPVLRIRFTPHDVTDRPLLHADMYFRGDSFSYKAVIKR